MDRKVCGGIATLEMYPVFDVEKIEDEDEGNSETETGDEKENDSTK